MKTTLLLRSWCFLCGILLLSTTPLLSQTDLWTDFAATKYARGSGTETNPYEIETEEQFAFFTKRVSANYHYKDEYFILKADLDLKDHFWVPIGKNTCPFSGKFNGNGYTIKNIIIHGDSLVDSSTPYYQGLFGLIQTKANSNGYVTIENLTLDSVTIVGKTLDRNNMYSCIGTLAGRIDSCTIQNCHVKNVDLKSPISEDRYNGYDCWVAGLVGYITDNLNLLNCSLTKATIHNETSNFSNMVIGGLIGKSGNYLIKGLLKMDNCHVENLKITNKGNNKSAFTGGIIGQLGLAEITNSSIVNANIRGGNTTSSSTMTGGFIGYMAGDTAYIENCKVTDSQITGGSTGTTYTGGLIGVTMNQTTINRSACINTTIEGGDSDVGGATGGLIGSFSDIDTVPRVITLTNSYAKEVTINSRGYPLDFIGGLVGNADLSKEKVNFRISGCYAEGTISVTGTTNEANPQNAMGGLIGRLRITAANNSATIENSYSYTTLNTPALQSGYGFSGGIAGQILIETSETSPIVKITNCFAAGKITDNYLNAVTAGTGGIVGYSNYTEITNCVAMLEEIKSTYSDMHRIVGKEFTGSNQFVNNYGYVERQAFSGNILNGENWSGQMAQQPINTWDNQIWTTDPNETWMPKLVNLPDQPDIPNLAKAIVYTYDVTIPKIEGVTSNPVPGNYTVSDGEDFILTLTIGEKYSNYPPTVKANGKQIMAVVKASRVYSYTLSDVKEDIRITIEDIFPEIPTATENIAEGEVQVYTGKGSLFIKSSQEVTIYIYTIHGTLLKNIPNISGTTHMVLDKGIYIVRIEKETYKVVIH